MATEQRWDGPAAMRTASTAAEFRQIAFELSNDSDPDTAAHWALPHHPRPGAGPDAGGVAAALGRLNQTGPTVMSKESIRNHLERHQGASEASRAAMPATKEEMAAHLRAPKPGGHGMSESEIADMSMEEKQAMHRRMHQGDAGHDHEGMMMNALSPDDREVRILGLEGLEIRHSGRPDEGFTLRGYAAVYNELSHDPGGGR